MIGKIDFKRKYFLALVLIVCFLVGVRMGYYLHKNFPAIASFPLRSSGFKYVKPVLLCNTNTVADFPQLVSLQNKLNVYIDQQKKAGNVKNVSVYFQDFKLNAKINTDSAEQFRTASMGKVPIMIALYRIAESDHDFLDRTARYIGQDLNSGQEIKPKDYAKPGQVYTVRELISKMIKYSDNNSTYMLISLMGPSQLKSLYQDLQVPFPVNPDHPENVDFITSRDMSYFFRILYNATYLSNELSDQVFEVLTQTDFREGIVAGVSDGVTVAHKFGLDTLESGGIVQERQLHDCGVVLHSKNPYLLCVMTKSSAELTAIENVIKNISSITYEAVSNYSK